MRSRYLLPKGSLGYSTQCINHSIANAGILIDKLALSVPIACFNKGRLLDISHPAFEILQWGDYISLALAGEAVDPAMPMYLSVIPMLQYLWQNGAFIQDIEKMLTIYLAYFSSYPVPWGYAEGLLTTLQQVGFRFSALELSFDFIGYIPFEVTDKTRFTQIAGTFYTKDYRESSSGPQDSLLIIYDKGSLLAKESGGYSPLPPEVPYIRLELRIKQQNGRRWLHIEDLRYNMCDYIVEYGDKIRRKVDTLTAGSVHFKEKGVPFILDRLITTGINRNQTM